jgi:hypothetical protein
MVKLLRYFGIKVYHDYKEIVDKIKALYTSLTFGEYMILIRDPYIKIWMVNSSDGIFFVVDKGTSIDIICRLMKKDTDYLIENNGSCYGKIVIDKLKLSIPFDKNLTGRMETLENKMKQFLDI